MNTTDLFSNLPDDLAALAPRVSVNEKPKVVWRESCGKCSGTGIWQGYGDCTGDRSCTRCKGRGYFEFRTSPDDRRRAREATARAKQRKADEAAAKVQAWRAAHPAESVWLSEAADREFEFAVSLLESLNKFGSLTEKQLAAVQKCVASSEARKAQWAAERAAREAAAPQVDATRLERSFETARANGLRWPRITMNGVVIKPAGANGKNPGALYVTEGEQYLGKVINGRFLKVRECRDEQEQQIVSLINDPVAAAEAYGKLTGHCCICNRELTNEESVKRGIGPVCATKFGW